jgi:hypothetical protein
MKYFKWIIAGLLGGVAGFSYWYFIGCNTGSCAITSSPVNSSIYGMLMGLLFLNMFSVDRKNAADQKDK